MASDDERAFVREAASGRQSRQDDGPRSSIADTARRPPARAPVIRTPTRFRSTMAAMRRTGSRRWLPGTVAVLVAAASAAAAPPPLQQQLDAAIADKVATVTLTPGSYVTAATVRLADVTGLTIVATGVVLLRADATKPGLVLDRCHGVAVRGLLVRCQSPPFVQGRVVAIDPERRTLDLRVDVGYFIGGLGRPTTGYAFVAGTRRWKPGGYDYGTSGFEGVPGGGGGGRQPFRARLTGRPGGTLAVGDDMAFRGPGATDVRLAGCDHCRLEDVRIENGSGFCVHEDGGEGHNYYRYTVTYGPAPDSGTEPPRIASNADAFHSSGVRHGPTLDSCHFEGMCDDGVPIHGQYAVVAGATGGDVVAANDVFRAGDPYRALDATGAEIGEGTVRAVTPAGAYAPPPGREKLFARRRFYRLTLDPPVAGLGVGCRLGDPAACGAGFVVRNCRIRNHRARGLLIKADDGLIEGNEIDGSTIAGLVISPEFYWNEAGYARHVVVRDNVFRHCGYATATAGHPQAATVCVTGEADHVGAGWGNRDITLEHNAFEDDDGCNLLVNDAAGVTITGNAFVRPQRSPTDRGTGVGVDPASLIVVEHSDDVRLSGNTVADPGPWEKHLVTVAPSATHVKGADDGVRVLSAR